jgi:hypothetical protein
MICKADFSPCRTWRYSLHRIWDENKDLVAFIGLNPSTADETQDDPTVRRCCGFVKKWGFGGLVMLNLFAFRATDPKQMKAAADPVGPKNDEALVCYTKNRLVVCAWGCNGLFRDRHRKVLDLLGGRRKLLCLELTKDHLPKHPLYLRADLVPFAMPTE